MTGERGKHAPVGVGVLQDLVERDQVRILGPQRPRLRHHAGIHGVRRGSDTQRIVVDLRKGLDGQLVSDALQEDLGVQRLVHHHVDCVVEVFHASLHGPSLDEVGGHLLEAAVEPLLPDRVNCHGQLVQVVLQLRKLALVRGLEALWPSCLQLCECLKELAVLRHAGDGDGVVDDFHGRLRRQTRS